jgi:chromosome segregation ATPase
VNELIGVILATIGGLIANVWKFKSDMAKLQSERDRIAKEAESDIIPKLTEQLSNVLMTQSQGQSGRITTLENKLEAVERENLNLIRELAKHEARLEGVEKRLTDSNKENTLLRGKIKSLKFENAELSRKLKECEKCRDKNG